MLDLLQSGSCSRRLYVVLLIAFTAFDFVKGPVTDYLERSKYEIQQKIYASDGAKLKQKFEAAMQPAAVAMNEEERAQQLDRSIEQIVEGAAGAIAMEAKSSAVGSIFISLMVAIGVASWLALIWMVFARLRDIGWPPVVGLAILALPVSLRVLNPVLSDIAWYAIQYLFFMALVTLAFIRGSFGATPEPTRRPGVSPNPSSRNRFGIRS